VGEAWLGSEACATATPTKLEGLSSNPSNKTEEIVEGTLCMLTNPWPRKKIKKRGTGRRLVEVHH